MPPRAELKPNCEGSDRAADGPLPPGRSPWPRRGVVLVGLLALTAWNATRSEALGPARQAYARAHYPTALRHALDHLDRRPWSREAARLAGLCLSRLSFADEAEPYYVRAGAPSLDDLHVRAFGLVRCNQRERAIAAYEQILERWPDDPVSLRRLATVQMTQGNMMEAIRLSERLAASPEREDQIIGYTMVASFNHNVRETEKAVSAFNQVLELDPELRTMPLPRSQFWAHYTQDLLDMGRPDRALPLLERGLREVGEDAQLWTILGLARQQLGELDEAEQCWRRAIALDPGLPMAWTNLGRVQLSRGKAEEAIESLTRASTLEPNNASLIYSLVLANRRLGRNEEVERLTRRGEELRKRFGTPTTGMGAGTPGTTP
jgi:tetratricopeptide (TPR) repeat protein